MERLLGEIDKAVEARAATGEDEAGGDLAVEAGALEVVADEREKFHGARLDDVGEHAGEDGARRAVADAGDFDGSVLMEKRRGGAAVAALDFFGFGNGRSQSDGEVVSEMIATYGNGAGVADYAAAVNDEFGGAAADVEEAAAEFAFVLGEASFGGS